MSTATDTMPTETKKSGVLLGTVIGGAAGAAIALLMAPKSGRELRSDLMDKVQTLQTKGQELLQVAKEKAADTAQAVKEHGSQLVDKAHDVTDRVAEASHQALDRADTTSKSALNQVESAAHRGGMDGASNDSRSTMSETDRTMKSMN